MGGKKLLIVESPAKAKTVGKYLGREFVVKSSVGHIRDLPKEDGAIKITPDGENHWHFVPSYEISEGKQKVVSELKSAIEQLLISISLPAILFLMCRAMPGRPGLAFGWVTTCLMLPGLVAPFITAKLGSMKHSSLYVIFIDIFFIFMPVILLFMYKSMQERVEIVIRLAAAAYVLICIFIPKLFVKPSTLTYASLFAVFINILLVLLACDEIKKTDDMIKSIAAMAAKEKERKLKKFKKES